MAQPGKARAWKVRGVMRLGSSNLPLGAIPIKLYYNQNSDQGTLFASNPLEVYIAYAHNPSKYDLLQGILRPSHCEISTLQGRPHIALLDGDELDSHIEEVYKAMMEDNDNTIVKDSDLEKEEMKAIEEA